MIITGDFNAKVGLGKDKEHGIGEYWLGTHNKSGDVLADFCEVNDLVITNTCFKHQNHQR